MGRGLRTLGTAAGRPGSHCSPAVPLSCWRPCARLVQTGRGADRHNAAGRCAAAAAAAQHAGCPRRAWRLLRGPAATVAAANAACAAPTVALTGDASPATSARPTVAAAASFPPRPSRAAAPRGVVLSRVTRDVTRPVVTPSPGDINQVAVDVLHWHVQRWRGSRRRRQCRRSCAVAAGTSGACARAGQLQETVPT